MQEEESDVNYHPEDGTETATAGSELGGGYHELETIGWFAVSQGSGADGNYQWWAGTQHGDFDSFLDMAVDPPYLSAQPHVFGSIMDFAGWNRRCLLSFMSMYCRSNLNSFRLCCSLSSSA